MLTLTNRLPDSIEVRGRRFVLNTDYRYWLNFHKCTDFRPLFKGNSPCVQTEGGWGVPNDIFLALVEFYTNPCPVPKQSDPGVDTLDFDIDAELIYSAFLQQYGIDIMEIDMHWHKFKALLKGITDKTLLGQVIGFRASTDKEFREQRNAWELPTVLTEEEEEQYRKFDEEWG